MEKIMATTDFSSASTNAVRYAAALAKAFQSKLLVAHIFDDNDAAIEGELDENTEMKNLHLDYIKGRVDINLNEHDIDIKGIVSKGITTDEIQQIATNEQASLIVMGMKGRGQTRLPMGSNTLKMIGKTNIPLLVIPEGAVFTPINSMVIALDFADRGKVANFPQLKKLMKHFNPQISVLNIQKKNSPMSADFIASKSATYRIWKDYNPKFHILEDKDVDLGINHFLSDHPAELLVMISKKKGFFEKIFSKSYTKSMTRQIDIPLLIVHSDY